MFVDTRAVALSMFCIFISLLQKPKQASETFTLNVSWNKENDEDTRQRVLKLLESEVDLRKVYGMGVRDPLMYIACSMVCYYGTHYSAFVFKPRSSQWFLFDDALVKCTGTWADVKEKCLAGGLRPVLIFYSRDLS